MTKLTVITYQLVLPTQKLIKKREIINGALVVLKNYNGTQLHFSGTPNFMVITTVTLMMLFPLNVR